MGIPNFMASFLILKWRDSSMAKRQDDEGEDQAQEEEDDEAQTKRRPRPQQSVSLYEPLFVWMFMLVVAVVLRIVIDNTYAIPLGTSLYSAASIYSRFILQFPGTFILPLIIGAIIGSAVGRKSTTATSAARSGMLNGIYASLVYAITIMIIYMITNYTTPQYTSVNIILLQDIAMPVVVFLATLEVFAVLSHLRKVQ